MHARERRKGRGRLCCVLLEDTIFARVLTTIECPAGGVGKGGDANAPPLSVMFANVEGRSEFKRFSGLGNSEPKHGKEVRAKLVIAARCPPHTNRPTNARAHTHTHTHNPQDPDNTPHVGGNTWAGGTGGRDTAGLGGKGGPYRLDKGHDVHQLSDEEKNDVPEVVARPHLFNTYCSPPFCLIRIALPLDKLTD
jgi:hypothetical protein